MSSLQRQLQVGLSIGLLLLLGLLWWGGSLALRNLTDGFVASRLQHDAETLLASLDFTSPAGVTVTDQGLGKIYTQPLSGHYYQLTLSEGETLVSRSLWDERLAFPVFSPGNSGHWRTAGPSGQELLLRVAGYRKQGRIFTLALAEDMTPMDQQLARFQVVFAALFIAAAMLILVMQSRIVSRSMRRLDPVREEIEQLASGRISTLSEDLPSEVQPLVKAFNGLLLRQQQRLDQSRNSLGNLAHALKGPLNLLLRQLEREELTGYPDVRDEMELQLERIRQLMERELKRARLAGAGVVSERFAPDEEIPALVGLLKQLYGERQLQIDYQLPDNGQLSLDREDMLELLGNLLDNACKWARREVYFSLEVTEQRVILSVEDDGSGVSDDTRAVLTERGSRVDESMAGHGLGLAIVKDMVGRYGGSLDFGSSARLGGLQVRVELPGSLQTRV